MKGDFSRIRFNPGKQYTAVLEQQGRVSLDADTNEQAAIDDYLRHTETVDVIGAFGAPEHDPGFAISISNNQIVIGSGRYYVQGLVCENRVDGLSYLSQPYLQSPSPTDGTLLDELVQAGGKSSIQVYLQVWQRLVTALDDPCLREPALGQADTTARLQTVWRVVAALVPPPAPPSTIGRLPNTGTFRRPSLLQARQNLAAEIAIRPNIADIAGTSVSPAISTAVSPGISTAVSPGIETIGTVGTIGTIGTVGNVGTVGTVGTVGNVGNVGTVGTVDTGGAAAAPAVDCCTTMYASTPPVSTGAMKASTAAAGSDCSCEPIPAAGYQGLENQLYRIEIHQGGTEATATFKWSRENGSVVSAITTVSGNTVVVESLGPDANLGFQANQWVEIFDDSDLFGEIPNSPGLLYQIQSIDPTVPSITLGSPIIGINAALNARVRRWDQTGPSLTSSGIPLSVSIPFPLENGIEVTFRAGTYQAGDYWTIPARTASGQIDWPPCGSNGDLFQPPHSTLVYNAPLACIHWDSQQKKAVPQDCRRIFFPLTEINSTTSKALHVTAINWSNDSLTTADVWVAKGLTVTLDGAPTSPITNGNFIVTLESIFNPFTTAASSVGLFSRAVNFQFPSTYIRTLVALDSTITVNGTSISWTIPYLKAGPLQVFTVNSINAGLLFGALLGQYARVRVRLIGNTISSGVDKEKIFLDGQSQGQTKINADGTTRIDLQLPSSTGEPSSDFESWFYVAPTLLITNLNVAFPALFVIAPNGNLTGVSNQKVVNGAEPPVSPFVTITANYRALTDTQVTLSLLDADGTPSKWANIDSPVKIHAGEVFTTAAINVTGNPQVNQQFVTVTITVQASIATAVGPIAATPVTFTLTGGSFSVIG